MRFLGCSSVLAVVIESEDAPAGVIPTPSTTGTGFPITARLAGSNRTARRVPPMANTSREPRPPVSSQSHKVTLRKRTARAGLQVLLERNSAVLVRERN